MRNYAPTPAGDRGIFFEMLFLFIVYEINNLTYAICTSY